MSRARLQEVGVDVPIVPATSVGSLPPTPELAQARAAARARRGVSASAETPGAVRGPTELERAAASFWIAKQEELGLDILVDGELNRDDGIAWFAGHLRGFNRGGLVRAGEGCFIRKPVLATEVRWTSPVTVPFWSHAQSLTQKPVKATLPGPYSLMDGSFNQRYPTRRAACLAIARELRKEAEALVRAGCRIIQLDEPALGGRPEELELAGDAIRAATRDLRAYVIVHACYGALAPVWPALAGLPADNLDLECVNSDFAVFRPMAKTPFAQDVSVGVVDVLSPKVDTPETVLRRVKKALTLLKPERVWVDPDCGLRERTVDEAVAQLAVVSTAAREARKGHGG